MKPIYFKEHTIVYSTYQPQYIPLPAYRSPGGEVITCWRLSTWECLRLLFTRKLWLRQLTFNTSLQPQLPQINYPFGTNK
jgi:hypothetical protein